MEKHVIDTVLKVFLAFGGMAAIYMGYTAFIGVL